MPRTELLSGSSGVFELKISCASRKELVAILRADYPFISRAQVVAWLNEGRFRAESRESSELYITLTPPEAAALCSSGIPAACSHCAASAPVVHQDARLLVLDKPSGLPSRPELLADAHTALQAALAHDSSLAGIPEQGLLHRLDTGTSGLLAFARTAEAHEELRKLWVSGSVQKIYEAIVSIPPPSAATSSNLAPLRPRAIELEIGHSAKSSRRMVAHTPSARDSWIRGRWQSARTEILEVLPSPDGAPDRALVRVRIATGVRHQIRVHLAAIGASIVGDPLYSKVPADRLMLHASELRVGEARAQSPARWQPSD